MSTANRDLDIVVANCSGFEIGRLEHKFRHHIAIAPHRHTYYEVLWSVEGSGTHYIDFISYEMTPRTLFFISPGQVHYSDIATCAGYALFFTEEFMISTHLHKDFLRSFPFYHVSDREPAIDLDDEHIPIFRRLFERLEKEYLSESLKKEDILRAYLQILLIEAERLYTSKEALHLNHPNSFLVQEFRTLIEEHFLSQSSVKDYAKCLHITANHLNDVTKKITGKTAGELIRERLLLEAKRLLTHSDLSIVQIAHHLNFRDPSYFGRFFRRQTSQSPGKFRRAIREKYQNPYK